MTVGDQNWSLVLWQKEPEGDITFLGSSVLVLGFALSLVLGSLVWVLSTKAEQADVYAALLEVSHQLGASPDMNSVFRVTGETCLRMTGVDRCGIFLWNEAERQFNPLWISSDRPEDVQQFLGLKLKYGEMALINKIVDEKRSVLVQPEKMGLINPSLVRLFKIRSVLVVPLVSKGNLIGAMTLDHEGKQRRFSFARTGDYRWHCGSGCYCDRKRESDNRNSKAVGAHRKKESRNWSPFFSSSLTIFEIRSWLWVGWPRCWWKSVATNSAPVESTI